MRVAIAENSIQLKSIMNLLIQMGILRQRMRCFRAGEWLAFGEAPQLASEQEST